MRSYWDYSLDAEPQNIQSTRAFDSEIFSPDTGFGGNGLRVVPTAEQNRLNISGSTGGGCVKDGPFAPPHFTVNVPKPQCLKRDFVPWIINRFGDKALVDELLAQPDYTSVVWTFEKTRTLTLTGPAHVHAAGHFGVGGVLGTMGDATNSPGGMYSSHVYRS
jgi:tyrosinase